MRFGNVVVLPGMSYSFLRVTFSDRLTLVTSLLRSHWGSQDLETIITYNRNYK